MHDSYQLLNTQIKLKYRQKFAYDITEYIV